MLLRRVRDFRGKNRGGEKNGEETHGGENRFPPPFVRIKFHTGGGIWNAPYG